jgi:hypothetical protein
MHAPPVLSGLVALKLIAIVLIVAAMSCTLIIKSRIMTAASTDAGGDGSARNMRILIYITTHLSASHINYLQTCWPTLLAQSQLFARADFLVYITEARRPLNTTLIKSVFFNRNVSVQVRPNPGYQQGAVAAMNEAFDQHWFDSYDWVIRLNPDVMIRNETVLLERFQDTSTHGIFVDCHDVKCALGYKCFGRRIHTDFFAFRPKTMCKNAFKDAFIKVTHLNKTVNAENLATEAFETIIIHGHDWWLPGTGPHHGECRVRGDSSPVIHTHNFSQVFPACLSWHTIRD